MKPMARWWPEDLGDPSSSGASNDTKYAYFGDKHRLAVQDEGKVRVFETGPKRITGFAQSQGHGKSMQFTSDDGTVGLDALKEV